MNPHRSVTVRGTARAALVSALGLALMPVLSGCLVIGRTAGGGWFLWPGSIVLTLLMALLYFLFRGR